MSARGQPHTVSGSGTELAQRKLIVVRPKIGTFVSFIDKELVEEVRHLRMRSGSGACGDGMLYADKKRY